MKYKHTTIKDFNALKVLQEAGVAERKAGEAVGKSYDTVRRVYKCDTWEDYRNDLDRISTKYGKKKTPRVTEEQSTTSIVSRKEILDLTNALIALNQTLRTKRRIF